MSLHLFDLPPPQEMKGFFFEASRWEGGDPPETSVPQVRVLVDLLNSEKKNWDPGKGTLHLPGTSGH